MREVVVSLYATIWEELGGRGAGVVLGLLIGASVTATIARLKRRRERRRILDGDARDTVVISHHLVETVEAPSTDGSPPKRRPAALRIRTLGQDELNRVVPNGHLASVLAKRAFHVTHRHTLISMEGREGSYLLETLTNFVCDRAANGPFEHDLYVMAPCCEPADLAEHQPITILLISVADLALFEDWPTCRETLTEHSSDGSRILTLMEMARRFRAEQDELRKRRSEGQRTRYLETMYILDLALDRRSGSVPVKSVPWGRFEAILKEMNLE